MRTDGARSRLILSAKAALLFLFWSAVFGLAYTQPPLYYSNQNQYFLHGLARGGLGFLGRDWLANTADPTPFFSTLVAFTCRYLHESLFYLYFILLVGIYFHALLGISDHLVGGRATPTRRLAFLALLVLLHSGLLRWASAQLFGVDYPWYFQAGVANQYILGAGLQPSVFGVLLVLSVSTFLQGRPMLAVTWSSLGAVMHSTYLLPAALLTLAYLLLLGRDRRWRAALAAGAWALLLVAPVLAYNLAVFAPSSPETFAESQHLLARFRIPHHTQVGRWLDAVAWAQVGWVVVAAALVWRGRLFVLLAVPFVLALALTLVQRATGSDTLALLFPWRVSSVLVPIATAVVLARLVNGAAACCPRWPEGGRGAVPIIGGAVLAGCVAGGVTINALGLGYQSNTQESKLLAFVRDNKGEADVYLLPVEVPNLALGKPGAASGNFRPPPRGKDARTTISLDLQRFRLHTGAPVYVDFKSIPYKDVEVLEWHRRLLWNQPLYERRRWDERIADELRARGVTHVVAAADRDIRCDALELVYADEYYRLYRLR